MYIAFADIVLEFMIALHEQVTHLMGCTAAHGCAQIEHLAMLFDQLFESFIVGVLQAVY